MDKLLQTDFIAYLDTLKPQVIKCSRIPIKDIKTDVVDDERFDIQDKKQTIKQPVGTGSVTYINPDKKIIAIIDYEQFLDLQPHQPDCKSQDDVVKRLELKKPDFIVYDLEEKSFFLLNELSQSSKANSKRADAINQLRNAIQYFSKVPEIKKFIDGFNNKWCIFSNRAKNITMPDFANTFNEPDKFFPEPDIIPNKQINSLNFQLIETTVVNV